MTDAPMHPPHAFHLSLPAHHFAPGEKIPYVTYHAHRNARKWLQSVFSLQLSEELYQESAEEPTDEPLDDSQPPKSLQATIGRTSRLYAQCITLDQLKYSGLSQQELGNVILHLLRLLTCTKSGPYEDTKLHFEHVGGWDEFEDPNECPEELTTRFALPTPARESILSLLIHLLANKGPLRSASNVGWNSPRLVIHWRVLYRLLLRTAPYLDEYTSASVRTHQDGSSRQSTILKRTVQLLRDARHFVVPETATSLWKLVRDDLLNRAHTVACFRGTILLYLLIPSKCPDGFYESVLPEWTEAWTNVDRCPEYDFLWWTLHSRARKFCRDMPWTRIIRQRLMTHAQYWLQLPIGGKGDSSSFRAANPRSRSCPSKLKALVGIASSYEEGMDFVAKIAKLWIASLGMGGTEDTGYSQGTQDLLRFLTFVTPYMHPSNIGAWTLPLGALIHYICYELTCRIGSCCGLKALEASYPDEVMTYCEVQGGSINSTEIPAHEIVILLHTLLPMCQQALYSKSSHVGRAGEAALSYLVQIDPVRTTPPLMEFALEALDISAVNSSHQAPSALSALPRLIQPGLRSQSTAFWNYLPVLLRLSLAGIDSNDQNKTIRTLILYRFLTSWIPVGGSPEEWPTVDAGGDDQPRVCIKTGTLRLGKDLTRYIEEVRSSSEYKGAIDELPESSLLRHESTQRASSSIDDLQLVMEEGMSAMSDWVLEFLERIFDVLRASGARAKNNKNVSGVASRHSSADVHAARTISRLLKETLMQVFASMSDEVHKLATRAVCRFISEESLPEAAKNSAILCQAVSACRESSQNPGTVFSPGFESLVVVLADDHANLSTQTNLYRIRCLAGAVRQCGKAVVVHQKEVGSSLEFALSSRDKHVFKAGCKLLRHTLSSLSESYPVSTDCKPRARFLEGSSVRFFGSSAQLTDDPILWHNADNDTVNLYYLFLSRHVSRRLDQLSEDISMKSDGDSSHRSRLLNQADLHELRCCLKVTRYAIRGGSSFLLDDAKGADKPDESVPYELSSLQQVQLVDAKTTESIIQMRMRLISFVTAMAGVVTSDTLYPEGDLADEDSHKLAFSAISADPKVCKETSLLAMLLLIRRGAHFRSQEGKSVWKSQKQMTTDFTLSAQVDKMTEILSSAARYSEGSAFFYKDGEDSGKTIPRQFLVNRVRLFHDSLQRFASFEVPRRLRKSSRLRTTEKEVRFSAKDSLSEMASSLESLLLNPVCEPLDAYEGLYDGLCALCSHSNTHVRANAIGVIDYAVTRFGWLLGPRVPRMLSAIALKDQGMNGKFGFPSCKALADGASDQGKRKRLAEAVKGICSILSLSRAVKHLLASEKKRLLFAETLCGTENLIALLPSEDVQKVVNYMQSIFAPFRSRLYDLHLVSKMDRESNLAITSMAQEILADSVPEAIKEDDKESVSVNWRKRLIGGWFLFSFLDSEMYASGQEFPFAWKTCYHVMQNDIGQPIQRVALGTLGRLVFIATENNLTNQLRELTEKSNFSRVLTTALVYDHRADTSFGGGHAAQWSNGVEDIIRDSTRNIAPKNLFPFQRLNQTVGTFKTNHCQLLGRILEFADYDVAVKLCTELLEVGQEMAAAPLNEDQKNMQVTSAEIFAGVTGFFLRSGKDVPEAALLQYLDEAMAKLPFGLVGAYFDGLRYAIQLTKPSSFHFIAAWLVEKVLSSLWQPRSDDTTAMSDDQQSNMSGTDGFTTQSKWLFLTSAILVEMDVDASESTMSSATWYGDHEVIEGDYAPENDSTWRLIVDTLQPRLLLALGHPFDSCRDHVARCLFRICYYKRKVRHFSNGDDHTNVVLETMKELYKSDGEVPYQDRLNALSTVRRFMSYCIHLGEAKIEFSEFTIPLLPLAFEALRSSNDDDDEESVETATSETVSRRSMEAEVIKAYRSMLAEVSVTAVISYGRPEDISKVLDVLETAIQHEKWQVRHVAVSFLRCFQGVHKFLLDKSHSERATNAVDSLLADERREVSLAAMAALTGILAASDPSHVAQMVNTKSKIANKSKMRRKKSPPLEPVQEALRARNQQSSVFFLCACVLSQPYDTPAYVPIALQAISSHSFDRNAPLGIRDTVKHCCAEYKRTHMSDNWKVHKRMFTQEQLDALDDVVSTPHYYA